MNVPIVIAAFIAARRLVPESREPSEGRVDVPGALAATVLASLTFAFVETGRGEHAVLVAAAGTSALVAFVAVERSVEHPMLPLGQFRRPAFAAANGVAGAMNLGTLGMLLVLMLYLQTVQGRTALEAGVALLPLLLPLSVIAPLAGRLTARLGPLPMTAGLLIATLGIGLLARAGAGSSYAELMPSLLLWGIGLRILTPAVVAAAVRTVPATCAGLASAVNNTARQAGGAIGIAAFGAIAGSTANAGDFVSGMHLGALLAAGLWLVAIAATLALIPARTEQRTR